MNRKIQLEKKLQRLKSFHFAPISKELFNLCREVFHSKC